MARDKRERAFALFDQGMRPSGPEVKELGIKRDTLYRYYRFWKSNNPSRTRTDNPSSPSGMGVASPNRTLAPPLANKTPGSFIKVVPKVTICGISKI